MGTIQVRVRRWGNSLGLILPSEIVESEKIKENQEINILILKDSRMVLRETFGILKGKLKGTAQEFKNEARRELYNS
ncbi:MAG: AbrB/MazE/SpoVT family DNA-binding domain-containing protein [Nanoarchaeota archaeon]